MKGNKLTIIKKLISIILAASVLLSVMMLTGCDEDEVEEKLGPKDIFYKVMDLIDDKEYTEARVLLVSSRYNNTNDKCNSKSGYCDKRTACDGVLTKLEGKTADTANKNCAISR